MSHRSVEPKTCLHGPSSIGRLFGSIEKQDLSKSTMFSLPRLTMSSRSSRADVTRRSRFACHFRAQIKSADDPARRPQYDTFAAILLPDRLPRGCERRRCSPGSLCVPRVRELLAIFHLIFGVSEDFSIYREPASRVPRSSTLRQSTHAALRVLRTGGSRARARALRSKTRRAPRGR